MSAVAPWHRSVLSAAAPAPAVIVAGEPGTGAHELAMLLAASFAGLDFPPPEKEVSNLLVFKKSDSKKEFHADKSADILVVRPDKNFIPVDAVRRVIEFCSLAPLSLPRRIAVILSAECMHTSAANALLKTLEEPALDKSLILAARAVTLLPPTIASRCQIIAAPMPNAKQAKEWLEAHGKSADALDYCGGMPFTAAQIDSKQITVAAGIFAEGKKLNIHEAAKTLASFDGWLECLQKWVSDGCRVACGLPARYFPGSEKRQLALCSNPRKWLDCHAQLAGRRPLETHPLAQDLWMKEILHDYRRIFSD